MAWMQRIMNRRAIPVSSQPQFTPCLSRFFSKSAPYIEKGKDFDFELNEKHFSIEAIRSLADGSAENRGNGEELLYSGCSLTKVGIPEFLKGIGKDVESHVAKLESEFGELQNLLVARTAKLKKIGIRCQHRKLILKYAHKYRLGLWRPPAKSIAS